MPAGRTRGEPGEAGAMARTKAVALKAPRDAAADGEEEVEEEGEEEVEDDGLDEEEDHTLLVRPYGSSAS